jgi:hypothetical protein
MTPAHEPVSRSLTALVIALCERGAHEWAEGRDDRAAGWFHEALTALDGRDFVDAEVDR